MLYLSKLVPNIELPSVMADVVDPSGAHKRVMRAFPDLGTDAARRDMGVLFRIERSKSRVVLLVQSTTEPDWKELGNIFLEPPQHKQIDSIIGAVETGRTLVFRLRANPTKQIPTGQKNPKRVGLFGEDNQLEWLKRKAANGGFKVWPIRVAHEGSVKTKDGKSFESVLFDGVLKVTDAEKFIKTVEEGVGPGKAYGFGLLSLAPFRGI